MNIYDELPPYIQSYIYDQGWDEFREIQIQAFECVLKGNENIILTAGTASGKTEAAFLPVLTKLFRQPSKTIGAIYISPLKALINDQFVRIDKIVELGGISINKWHGDVSSYSKKKLLNNPTGILQITVESLEMLISNKHELCQELFGDLRYIIIDEMHYFMDSARGTQLLSVLERLQRIIKQEPLRIGLSATLGDVETAKKWISMGSLRKCVAINDSSAKKKIGVVVKNFAKVDETINDDELIKYLYQSTKGYKSIIFANSRSEVEYIATNLRRIAEIEGRENYYLVHHGNISVGLRDDVETKMKNSEEPYVTIATVTLELGIDIGRLERVVQVGTPYSVSSFSQRVGRCGRRGQRAEIIYVKEERLDKLIFPEMDWELLRGIAILQLYITKKWVEPIKIRKKPYSVLYHQIIMNLRVNGIQRAELLAQQIMTLDVFNHINLEDFKQLLKYLIDIGHIEKNADGLLRLSEKSEQIAFSYKFCSVFDSQEMFLVRTEKEKIGEIQIVPKNGEKFVLAGYVWICKEVNWNKREIVVVKDKVSNDTKWLPEGHLFIHQGVIDEMRNILMDEEIYRYLDTCSVNRLKKMREFCAFNKIMDNAIIKLANGEYVVIPWKSSNELDKLEYALAYRGYTVKNKNYYLLLNDVSSYQKLSDDVEEIMGKGVQKNELIYPYGISIQNKYNEYIPQKLLTDEWLEDYLYE